MIRKLFLYFIVFSLSILAIFLGFAFQEKLPRASLGIGVVFGTTVSSDGVPSDRLQARLDRALELYNANKFEYIFVSGGIGKEGVDESQVMFDYLFERGVPEAYLIQDSEGNSTHETVYNLIKYVGDRDVNITIISQYFHIPRIRMLFAENGYLYYPSTCSPGGHTYLANYSYPRYFELRDIYSILRELVAIPVYWYKYRDGKILYRSGLCKKGPSDYHILYEKNYQEKLNKTVPIRLNKKNIIKKEVIENNNINNTDSLQKNIGVAVSTNIGELRDYITMQHASQEANKNSSYTGNIQDLRDDIFMYDTMDIIFTEGDKKIVTIHGGDGGAIWNRFYRIDNMVTDPILLDIELWTDMRMILEKYNFKNNSSGRWIDLEMTSMIDGILTLSSNIDGEIESFSINLLTKTISSL